MHDAADDPARLCGVNEVLARGCGVALRRRGSGSDISRGPLRIM